MDLSLRNFRDRLVCTNHPGYEDRLLEVTGG
jgi:hypothetical protein